MATFQELMRAAVNAAKAGDADAARQLVDMARSLRGQKAAPPAVASPPGLYSPDMNTPLVPASTESAAPVVSAREVDSFGDTIGRAMDQPIAATKAYAGGLVDQSRSPTMQALPDWVPEGARSPVAYAGDSLGAAAGGLGTAMGFAAGLAGETLGGSPTNERKLARDLTMMGQVAVPELSGVSGAALAAGNAARAAQRLEGPATAAQRGARAADDLGITPSLGAGGKVRGMTAATLEKVPGTGGVIAKDAGRFVDEVETAFQRIAGKVGKATTPSEAGATLQRGLGQFVKNFRDRSNVLFRDVGAKIPDGTKIQAPDTIAAIRDAIEPFAGNPEIARQLGLNKWASIADDLENGVSWRAALDLRTSIGESIGKINGPLANMDQGKLKLAYGKLTGDLEAAAKAAGPEAESAWRRANNYYRRGAERIETALDKTIRAESPERAFEAFANMAKKDRASSDAQRMFKIKASMPREEWREVSASIIDRMGRARPGGQDATGEVFSPAKFLTEWNGLSDEAKSVLLPKDLRAEMNKLAEVASLAKSANAERNFSNTGTIMTGAGAGAAMTQAPVTTASLLAGSFLSAKAMTSPVMLRALNKMARGDTRAMRAVAKGGSPLAQEARTILRMTAAESAAGGSAANALNPPAMQVLP